ncbi:MAG: hypothetical protein ACXVP1_06365, partial [Thermoleophilia bacterium]
AKDAERDRAREMRLEGTSYAEIVAALGVSKSSISLWVRDLPRPPSEPTPEAARRAGAERQAAKRRRTKFIERQNETLRWATQLGELSDRELLIAGAVAYWAEGSKSKPWRHDESVTFINSDPDMVRLFLAWLDLLGVPRSRLGFRVHIHESADVDAAQKFWADIVGVEAQTFKRPTIKRHRPSTVRRNVGETYHGCLVVRVAMAADLYRRMEGVWWAVAATARRPPPTEASSPQSELVPLVPSASGEAPPGWERLMRFRRILVSAHRRRSRQA